MLVLTLGSGDADFLPCSERRLKLTNESESGGKGHPWLIVCFAYIFNTADKIFNSGYIIMNPVGSVHSSRMSFKAFYGNLPGFPNQLLTNVKH